MGNRLRLSFDRLESVEVKSRGVNVRRIKRGPFGVGGGGQG